MNLVTAQSMYSLGRAIDGSLVLTQVQGEEKVSYIGDLLVIAADRSKIALFKKGPNGNIKVFSGKIVLPPSVPTQFVMARKTHTQ